MTGWITAFFPYLLRPDETQMGQRTVVTTLIPNWQMAGGKKTIVDSDFPQGVTNVPVKWKYFLREYRMELESGFMAVAVEEENQVVTPIIGWLMKDAD